jgi:hypothetical protein
LAGVRRKYRLEDGNFPFGTRLDARFERLLARKCPGLRYRITDRHATRAQAHDEEIAGNSSTAG